MKLFVTVDSIEGELASLLLRGEEEERPLGVFSLAALPNGVEEGDILSLHFAAEPEETEAACMRAAELQRRLLERK